jgi:hypothetical protein
VRKSTIYLFILGVVMIAAMTFEGLVVSAQNSNSSTTMAPANTNSKPRRTSRRSSKKPANANAADQTMSDNTNMSANTNTGRRSRRGRRGNSAMTTTGDTASMQAPKRTGRCDPTQQEQTDLSGTYTGKARHGTEPAQDATLTITGNNFTMTSGTENHTGRITAVTTCGYTAVTMMMGDLTPPTPSPNPPAALPAMSLRAKKVGDKLWLTSVPGDKMSVSFTPTGGAMKPKPHKRRTTKKTETTAPPTPTP